MGNTAATVPGTLNLVVKAGEFVSQLVDFSVDLTGYTFEAEIVSAVTFSQVVALDVTDVDLEVGQVNVSLPVADAADVAPGTYLWRLVWTPDGGAPRTALEGIWEATR